MSFCSKPNFGSAIVVALTSPFNAQGKRKKKGSFLEMPDAAATKYLTKESKQTIDVLGEAMNLISCI